MRVNWRLVVVALMFWATCFFVGYKYSSSFQKVYAGSTANSLGNVAGIQIQDIAPTDLEVLSLETYSPIAFEYSLLIADSIPNYYGCQFISFSEVVEATNPNDLSVLINKQHKINDAYAPTDLVLLSDYGIPTTAKIYARREAVEHFLEMYKDMAGSSLNVTVSSAYRSLNHQQRILDNWISRIGTSAYMYAAKPGFSEHHLGTAIDVLTSENSYTIGPNYFNTRAYKWLATNAYKYGFVLSYPQGKEALTGYNPEGWHYRYVGIELATKIHNENISAAEYLFRQNNICY